MKVISVGHANSGAIFDEKKIFRFSLWRRWNPSLPTFAACLLNPSTADEERNDPTVERVERRAMSMGFGKLIITNLYALRSTNPLALYDKSITKDPTGDPDNYEHILSAAQEATIFLCGWGEHGKANYRGFNVKRALIKAGLGIKLRCIVLNSSGEPKHPLYCAYETPLKEFK